MSIKLILLVLSCVEQFIFTSNVIFLYEVSVFFFVHLSHELPYQVSCVYLPICVLRVRKQVVNIPSFVVRLDSQKHIDFSLNSPFGGGGAGRVKRKNLRKAASSAAAPAEEDEE